MAITVIQAPAQTASAPGNVQSLHSPMWHVVSSTNVAQPDFRFVFEIYVGSGAVFAGKMKVLPDSSGNGVIDVSRVVRSFLANYFAPITTASPFVINTDGISVPYIVAYGEEYGGTEYLGVSTLSYTSYNAYVGDTPGGGSHGPMANAFFNWATDRDITNIRMPRNGRCFLSYINDPAEDHTIEIQEVDEDGVPINVMLSFVSQPITSLKKLLVLDLNLEFINGSAAFNAPPTPIPSTAAGYRIRVIRDGAVDASEWAVVRWLCEPKVDATPVHFMNRYGAFDTFHFTGPTRKSVDIERKTYQRIGSALTGSSLREYNTVTHVYADTVINYNTKHTWGRKFTSGYVDDAAHEWLWQLVASPEVYFEHDAFYYPVRVKTAQWNERLTRFDKMYNLELEVFMGRQVISQSR